MHEERPYKMSISLNVLNHLGIGLYSNIPAVLSEVVANAWDADATEVRISLAQDEIRIHDNGIGMSKDDINNKYLMVGYSKRTKEPGPTPRGRAPMGRKGIGKLSVFSIADLVEVHTVKDDEYNGLRMSGKDIQARIKESKTDEYEPEPIANADIEIQAGTLIKLRDLKKWISRTESNLRRRLARRFSIIGAEHDFHVFIDDVEITAKDRDFYEAIEFVWYFGEESADIVDKCGSALKQSFQVSPSIDETTGYVVRGWLATVDERRHIDEQNNTIVIFAHGKLIQEDLLKDFAEGGIYSKYLIGEIDADFMDLDDRDDIVTSDRQRVKVDDERYDALKEFIWNLMKTIQNEWTTLRTNIGVQRALDIPVLKDWYDRLKGDHKDSAKKMFGKIESLKVPDSTAKTELYKASLLAFEKMALDNTLSVLDSLETEEDFTLITKIFRSVDEVEAAHYYQIAKGRLNVVKKFTDILPEAKERVLQQHIFDHLWLLDPSWERAAYNARIEQAVTTEFNTINASLTEDEKKGRIDIRYRTAAGKHIIIELKRYNRPVTVDEILVQLRKYRDALEKCLMVQFPNESRVIECISILGSPPEPRNREQENINILKQINARYITYDTLILETLKSYEDYLEKEKRISELITLIDSLDMAFALPTPSSSEPAIEPSIEVTASLEGTSHDILIDPAS